MVVKEVLRINPPAALSSRTLEEPTKVRCIAHQGSTALMTLGSLARALLQLAYV